MDTEKDNENVNGKQVKKYLRGKGVHLKEIKDKKLKGQLAAKEALYGKSARNAAKVEQWLLPSEGGYLEAEGIERTSNFRQENIVREVDLLSSRKAFDLKLPGFGPYAVDYTLSGRHMVIAGRKGHISMMEWKNFQLTMELQVRETVHDVKFLHNELFFATAQKKYVYIYDKNGTEIHCLKEHREPLRLEFLSKHFLLASISKSGVLRYQDTSTGNLIATHRTRLGRCVAMRMNPYNAVLGLGHNNGTVTMWSPNMGTPLVSTLCHHGPVTALAFDLQGHQMVTAGNDGRLRIWDLRKFSPLHSYSCHAKSVDISQRGLLAVGCGSLIEIWKDALITKQNKPYLRHRLANGSQVQDIGFCPYEDVLAIGHATGISSILVPGSGEPNFDTFVANPFETVKQRREKEVHSLLDKLQPEMIMLDPESIGAVQHTQTENMKIKREKAREADMQAAIAAGKSVVLKNKTKGRNKPSKRYNKKQENIIRAKRPLVEEKLKSEQANKRPKISDLDLPKALERFVRK
ncbi:probable U3 small nucleolar RNA-associated protein 7 [Cryptomeria japonica]|uniref:probable U3 small nucleolar RNA-associated protein 7 n=1 Tax=Cryptomeria japonica TaxID=3369 RepID=UPI0025ACB0A0|nr:probable U3 small nucleolar RNA-associated protein 7 [Cryptomeria japonica]XP_057820701.1 probable U3 small nucleolar RNA-associated protein 7 [Cryptomeria japonica]